MDLRCVQPHMKGQKVLVEGNLYTVGPDGIVRGVSEADAQEMLKMPASWRELVTRTPVAAQPAPMVEEITPVLDLEQAAVPSVPAEVEAEWPDPEESMELGYLQKMADAYEVKYDAKTTKKTLVKNIKKAMYE